MHDLETGMIELSVDRDLDFDVIRPALQQSITRELDRLVAAGFEPIGRAELHAEDDFARNQVCYTLTVKMRRNP